jgi:TatD DNase family protein
MLIDTHAHLTYPQLADERAAVIERADASGVTRIIDVGTNEETSRKAVESAAGEDRVYASAGFHPHDSASADEAGLAEIRKLLTGERVVAVGETGLDFFRDYAPHDLQERLFRRHIEMAVEVELPLILHSRGAEDRVIDLLIEMGARKVGGVLHCFGGSVDQASRAIDAGFCLGFGGTVTFKNSDSLQVAMSVPDDRLLLETDCPYLAPVPFRGKRNEPAYVKQIAEHLASSMSIPFETLAERTTSNAVRLFGLEA